jgi:hypothetical protein
MGESLARGAQLTPETWADFVARLHHDCVGEGVKRHYTADAVFLVEKRVWQAVTDEVSDICRVYTDGHDEPLADFFNDLEPDEQAALCNEVGGPFLEADAWNQAEALDKLHPDSLMYHAAGKWEFVCQHFTRDAAEAFIKRKGHDYREGLRIYVDASCYSWELNAIKAAILDGRIGLAMTAIDAALAAQREVKP